MALVVVGFDWDRGNRSKCQKHGVSIAVIESLFHGPIAVFPDPEHSAREERFKVTRRTAIGGLAGAAAVAAGATSAWYLWPRAPKPVMRLNMDVSPAQQFAGFT